MQQVEPVRESFAERVGKIIRNNKKDFAADFACFAPRRGFSVIAIIFLPIVGIALLGTIYLCDTIIQIAKETMVS